MEVLDTANRHSALRCEVSVFRPEHVSGRTPYRVVAEVVCYFEHHTHMPVVGESYLTSRVVERSTPLIHVKTEFANVFLNTAAEVVT